MALSLRNPLRSRGWGAADPPAFARQSRITGTLVSVNRAALAACDSQSALHWHSRPGVDPPSTTPIALAAPCRFLLTPSRVGCSRARVRAGGRGPPARGWCRATSGPTTPRSPCPPRRGPAPPGPDDARRSSSSQAARARRPPPTTPTSCSPSTSATSALLLPAGPTLPTDHPPRVRSGASWPTSASRARPRRGGARAMRAIYPGIPPCVRAPGRA
jgi:hypothetical protein